LLFAATGALPLAARIPLFAASHSLERIAGMAAKGTRVSAIVRQQMAAKRRDDLLPVIEELRSNGAISLRVIANGLNKAGLSTARGGLWTPTQVMRLSASKI
jgi:hypothetical protein